MKDISRQNHVIAFRHIDQFIATYDFDDLHLECSAAGKFIYRLMFAGVGHLEFCNQKRFVEPDMVSFDSPLFFRFCQCFFRYIRYITDLEVERLSLHIVRMMDGGHWNHSDQDNQAVRDVEYFSQDQCNKAG